MPGKMKTWISAFSIACLVEVPALLALMTLSRKSIESHSDSVLGQILIVYHILAFPFGMSMLYTWGGSRQPPVPGSEAVLWFSVDAAQVLLTTPIIALVLKGASYFANRTRS
jgi:hypothetical protein